MTSSSLNKTNCNHRKFQPQIQLVPLQTIFPNNEFKQDISYNLKCQTLKINNILEVEKYLINRKKKNNSPTVIEDDGKLNL
jgi:hypothetical protein